MAHSSASAQHKRPRCENFRPSTRGGKKSVGCAESGLAYDIEKVDLASGRTEAGAQLADINPKRVVPVLELDNDERLTEGPVIAQYGADSAGHTDLMPAAGNLQRYRVMEWQNFLTSEIHKGYGPLFKPQVDTASKEFFRQVLRSRFEWIDSQLGEKPI